MPGQQIMADRMPPRHVAPLVAEWIVLEVEMILSTIIEQPVGVVLPVLSGCEVIFRAKLSCRHCFLPFSSTHRTVTANSGSLVKDARVCTFAHLMAAFRLSSCCGSRPSPR